MRFTTIIQNIHAPVSGNVAAGDMHVQSSSPSGGPGWEPPGSDMQKLKDRLPPAWHSRIAGALDAASLSPSQALHAKKHGAWEVVDGQLSIGRGELLVKVMGLVVLAVAAAEFCFFGWHYAIGAVAKAGDQVQIVVVLCVLAGCGLYVEHATLAPCRIARKLVAAARGAGESAQ